MSMTSEVTKSYQSFSGVDIQATFANKIIGTLQGVSYTITREKAPVYTMGSADPRAFSRGKRGIAGSLIFVVLNRSNLLEAMGEKALFWASQEDITYQRKQRSAGSSAPSPDQVPNAGVDMSQLGEVRKSYAWYHDQLPPFNITLTGMTEYGAAMRMELVGVEILNAGSGISIDDITTDENMTFVARGIVPWRYLGGAPVDAAEGFHHAFTSS